MARKPPPPADDDGEVAVLTDAELAEFRPARDVLPAVFFEDVKRKPGQRGPGRRLAKIQTTIRLDPTVVAAFKAQGRDWQKDVNAVLLKEVARRARKRSA